MIFIRGIYKTYVKGLRNIVAHNYFGIDAEEIWQIVQTHLRKLNDEVSTILDEITQKRAADAEAKT